MLSPERLALPDYEYLAQRHVLTYMEDAVCQLLENKEDISQYGIARFFTEYFNSVCQGTHILFREFSFIQATPHNRASFLRAFWRCFRTVGKNGDLLTMKEYHCLLQLLCPDFPLELTQKAARIVLMDDAMDCLMSFSDFLFAFQIQFYYSEFLESVAAIYQDLLSGKNPNTVIVPTSSSGQHRQRPALGEASMLEGVEASLFYQCLENLCDRHKYSCPPPALVKEVLNNVQRLTFYGFLVALSKHHGINQALGWSRSQAWSTQSLPAQKPAACLPEPLPGLPPPGDPSITPAKWMQRAMAPLKRQTSLRLEESEGSYL
ncbi:centriolar satellite-associated tubulin polyglutamylase complex regulator 1 isoform 3-T3 [Dugong dugon]